MEWINCWTCEYAVRITQSEFLSPSFGSVLPHSHVSCMQHYDAKKRRLGGRIPNHAEVAYALLMVLPRDSVDALMASQPEWMDEINRLDAPPNDKKALMQKMALGGDGARVEWDARQTIKMFEAEMTE